MTAHGMCGRFVTFESNSNRGVRFEFESNIEASQVPTYSAPANPLAGGEGLAAPPQEPHPRSRPSILASPTPTPKLVQTPLQSAELMFLLLSYGS